MAATLGVRPLLLCGVLALGCSLSPLHRKIKVGEEAFVLFAATGPDGNVDLFASAPVGGEPVRLTFTAMRESMPRLTPRGDMVAFIRDRSADGQHELVIMNLLSGAERLLELPPETGTITALGWSDTQDAVYLQGATGRWRVSAPPAAMEVALLDAGATVADSAFLTVLGSPPFARAESCPEGGVCVIGPSGTPSRISSTGQAPFRWGSDSVAWFDDNVLMIRPLGPGSARQVRWDGLREVSAGSFAEP